MANTPSRISGLPTTADSADAAAYTASDIAANATTQKIAWGDVFGTRSLAGAMLFVDPVNGSDSTGTRGSIGYPFLTLGAAKTAAQSGDQINPYPGTYAVTSSLAKAGVNWNFCNGVTITRASGSIFDDGGTAMSYRVTGRPNLTLTGTSPGTDIGCVVVNHASSVVYFEGGTLYNNADEAFGSAACVFQGAGTIVADIDKIQIGNNGNNPYGLWWHNGSGKFRVRDVVGAAGYWIGASVSSSPTGDWFVNADSVTGSGFGVIQNISTQAEAKLWLNITLLTCNGPTALLCSGGKSYLTAQKVQANGSSTSQGIIDVSNSSSAAKVWATVQKLTGNFGYGIKVAGSGSSCLANLLEVENLGSMNSGGTAPAWFSTNSSGTLTINGTSY